MWNSSEERHALHEAIAGEVRPYVRNKSECNKWDVKRVPCKQKDEQMKALDKLAAPNANLVDSFKLAVGVRAAVTAPYEASIFRSHKLFRLVVQKRKHLDMIERERRRENPDEDMKMMEDMLPTLKAQQELMSETFSSS